MNNDQLNTILDHINDKAGKYYDIEATKFHVPDSDQIDKIYIRLKTGDKMVAKIYLQQDGINGIVKYGDLNPEINSDWLSGLIKKVQANDQLGQV